MKTIMMIALLTLTGCGGGSSPQAPAIQPAAVVQKPAHAVSVVFIGDSLMSRWTSLTTLVPGSVNVAVGGQTTAQMLARFQADVIDKRPAVVVLEGGVNDIVSTIDPAPNNTAAMVQMAQAAGIKVIVLGVLPAQIPYAVWEYNVKVKAMAQAYGVTYVDTYYPFCNERGEMRADLFLSDGVHLNDAGYEVFWNTLKPVIAQL